MHTLPFCSQRHTMYAFGEGRWIAISKFDRRDTMEVNRSLRVSCSMPWRYVAVNNFMRHIPGLKEALITCKCL